MEFLEGLSEAHMEADKVRQRKRLAAPHFAKEEVPEEPKEITDFFKHFDKTSEADKIAQRSRFKKEQQEFLSSMKPDISKKAKTQRKPEQVSGSKRVPTPPARPGEVSIGSTASMADQSLQGA